MKSRPHTKHEAKNTVKQANPQGKGLVPLLDSLSGARACVAVPAKTLTQISSELFTSMFVLHSQFSFRPVAGKSYYLYRRANGFVLSLIAPHEWGGDYGRFVGTCVLQKDISWTLTMDKAALGDQQLMAFIENSRKQFEQTLHNSDDVEKILPGYVQSLPFYQRALAWALTGSLRISMAKAGYQGLGYKQIKRLSGGTRSDSDDQ